MASVLLIVLSSLLLLLCVPLLLEFAIHNEPEWGGYVRLSWGGIVSVRHQLGARSELKRDGTPPETPAAAPVESRKRDTPTKRKKPRRRRSLGDLFNAIPHFFNFITRLFAQTRIRTLEFNCRAGLADPADTGMLCGALAPAFAALNASDQSTISFWPDFTEQCFDVQSRGKVSFVPVRYLLVVLTFVMDPKTWRLGYRLARG
jgi:hypothetical protein